MKELEQQLDKLDRLCAGAIQEIELDTVRKQLDSIYKSEIQILFDYYKKYIEAANKESETPIIATRKTELYDLESTNDLLALHNDIGKAKDKIANLKTHYPKREIKVDEIVNTNDFSRLFSRLKEDCRTRVQLYYYGKIKDEADKINDVESYDHLIKLVDEIKFKIDKEYGSIPNRCQEKIDRKLVDFKNDFEDKFLSALEKTEREDIQEPIEDIKDDIDDINLCFADMIDDKIRVNTFKIAALLHAKEAKEVLLTLKDPAFLATTGVGIVSIISLGKANKAIEFIKTFPLIGEKASLKFESFISPVTNGLKFMSVAGIGASVLTIFSNVKNERKLYFKDIRNEVVKGIKGSIDINSIGLLIDNSIDEMRNELVENISDSLSHCKDNKNDKRILKNIITQLTEVKNCLTL